MQRIQELLGQHVSRKGDWYNLNYCHHHLGYGSRLLANRQLEQNISYLSFCKTLSNDPEYSDAQDFIRQAENTLFSASKFA